MADPHGAPEAHAPAAPSHPAGPGGNDLVDIINGAFRGFDNLVDAVKEIPGVAKDAAIDAWYASKAIGLLGIGAMFGGIDALVLGGGFGAGTILKNIVKGESLELKEIANSISVGSLLAIPTHYIFGWIADAGALASQYGKTAGVLTRALLGIASLPPFIEMDEGARRIAISDYKPVPFAERWKGMLKTAVMFSPLVALNMNLNQFIQSYNPIYGAAFNSTFYSAFFGIPRDKKEEKPNDQQASHQMLPFPHQSYMPQEMRRAG